MRRYGRRVSRLTENSMANGKQAPIKGFTADTFFLNALTGLHDLRGDADSFEADQHTVAVLPFTNISGDSAQQYLCDGITEDIMIRLARFREMKVWRDRRPSASRGILTALTSDGRLAYGILFEERPSRAVRAWRFLASCWKRRPAM